MTPPIFNSVERPQDLSQYLYNFYTLLLIYSHNFPKLLDVKKKNFFFSLHPNKHAPLKTINCRSRPNKPFVTPELIEQKSKRSRLETAFRRNRSPENKSAYKTQCSLVSRLITRAKRFYYRNFIASNQHCPKKIWNALDSLLGRKTPKTLPTADSPSKLATSFLNFFNDKITKLCSSIPTSFQSNFSSNPPSSPVPPQLSEFGHATIDEIRNLVLSSTDATCTLDIIPTKLLKS
jgi:hypothetical protein